MNKNFKAGAQGGFTLIELIVVIVILGILAATALPKFANLSSDARLAALQGAKGALSASSAMVHGKFLVDPSGTKTNGVNVEGTTVSLTNGYPTASDNFAIAAGVKDDFTTSTTGSVTTVAPKSVADSTKCKVTYTNATVDASTPPIVTPPVIAVVSTDCN